jgi:hypothetical protein
LANEQSQANDATLRQDLLSELGRLSPNQLESGVQDREEFSERHLASRQRQNTADEGSTVSLAKRYFTWALCVSAIGILLVCVAMLCYLVVEVAFHLSKSPDKAGSVLWSIVTHGAVAAASMYFQKVLRKNLD